MEMTKEITIKLSAGELIAIGTYIEERIEQEFGHAPSKDDLLDLMKLTVQEDTKISEQEMERKVRLLAAVSANLSMRRQFVTQLSNKEVAKNEKTARA